MQNKWKDAVGALDAERNVRIFGARQAITSLRIEAVSGCSVYDAESSKTTGSQTC